jgi:hypothetical protein
VSIQTNYMIITEQVENYIIRDHLINKLKDNLIFSIEINNINWNNKKFNIIMEKVCYFIIILI